MKHYLSSVSKQGISMFASISSHFSYAASAAVADLVLLLLTGRDACISSLDILLFLRGISASNLVVDVEGIFPT